MEESSHPHISSFLVLPKILPRYQFCKVFLGSPSCRNSLASPMVLDIFVLWGNISSPIFSHYLICIVPIICYACWKALSFVMQSCFPSPVLLTGFLLYFVGLIAFGMTATTATSGHTHCCLSTSSDSNRKNSLFLKWTLMIRQLVFKKKKFPTWAVLAILSHGIHFIVIHYSQLYF